MTKELLQQAVALIDRAVGQYFVGLSFDEIETVKRLKALAQQKQPAQEQMVSKRTGTKVGCINHDCDVCQSKSHQEQPSTDLTQDLAMMNRRLVLSVQRLATFDSKHLAFADRCQSWLRDKGLAGTPLCDGELNGQEAVDDWKHPDDSAVEDDKAVDAFAAAMKAKLAQARAKGRTGWQQCSKEELSYLLHEHVEKGDPRDVANFCMFLHSLGHGIVQRDAINGCYVAQPEAHCRGEK